MPKSKSSNPLDIFPTASDTYRNRIIGLSRGEVGTGKTRFWLTAPGPIVVFSLDQGLEGVVEEFAKAGKEIRVREYDWAPPPVNDETTFEERQEFQTQAIDIRDQLMKDFEIAVQFARTVLIDKETDVWELFRYAEFGGPSDAPRNYPALNQRVRKLVNLPKAVDCNFGLIQSMKDQWVTKTKQDGSTTKGFNTGERVPQGFGELEGLVHVVLNHRREGGKFYIDIGKARGPGSLDVQDVTFENVTFAEVGHMLFTDTTEEDWQ